MPRAVLFIIILAGLFSSKIFAVSTDDLIARAEAAQAKSEYRTALIHLKNAAKQTPENLLVHLKMAQLFVDTGQGVQANVEIKKANRLGAKPVDTAVLSAKAKLLLGEFEELTENIDFLDLPQTEIARLRAIQGHAFYEQRKFSQSKNMFQRAVLLSPDELEVELGQVKIYALDKEASKQKQLITSLLSRYPRNADVLIVAGNYYRNIEEFDRALELFKQAGEIQPSNVNVWFGVVRTLIATRSYSEAKTEIQKVLINYPEHQVGNYLLAVIAFEQNDINRARAAIEIVLKGEKRKYEALKLLSIIQFQQQEYTESEKNLKKYLKYHPDDLHALKTLAAIYLKRKQGVLALNILNPLESLDDAYIYSMMATAYLQTGNKEKSVLYINKSLQAAPDDRVIQRHLQRSKLQAGETLEVQFTDSDFNNFLGEGYIPILNLLRQKQYDKTIQIIQGYMEKNPKNAMLHYLLASTYLYQGNIEDARKQFKRSLKFNPKMIESRINLAKIYQMEGKERDAEKEFRQVLKYQSNNDQSMIALAGIFSRAGNETEMLKWLNKSRKMNAASLASREVLEDFYRQKGEKEKALEIAEEMVEIQPQNVDLLLKLANNQKANNRLDLAVQSFKKIIELKPELSTAWFGLGRLQYLNNELAEAKTNFEKTLQLDPKNLTAKVILVQIAIQSNQLASAEKLAKTIQQQHPDSPAGFDMLGDIYIKLNKPDKAIPQYQQSVKLKYDSVTYLKLHSSYNLNNQVTKGFDLLKQWTHQFPKDLQLKEVLALTYKRRGEMEKAKELYEEIIQKSRINDRALNNLALVSLALESPMSIEYAEMAFNIHPEKSKNKDTLGWVLFNNHNQKKGFLLLKEATEISPEDSDIRYHYAFALSKLGETAQAKKHLFIALGSSTNFQNRNAAEELLKTLK